jgi:formamidopyrimidine-DNA glycosylase
MNDIVSDLPLRVESIDVKGKFMWWTLSSGSKKWYMWSTYGMSGQWTTKQKPHTCFTINFNNDSIHFVDPRHFGTIKFTNDDKVHAKKLATLGPDILDDTLLHPELFAERILLKPTRTISEALMDQTCVSGVGNYLKSEALHRSGISPHRVVIDLKSEEIEVLWSNVILAARESYADHGASIRTYKTVEDATGNSQFYFRIYSKKQCPAGHPTLREQTDDGRTSWWCSSCQK